MAGHVFVHCTHISLRLPYCYALERRLESSLICLCVVKQLNHYPCPYRLESKDARKALNLATSLI